MPSKTNYLEDAIINQVLRGTTLVTSSSVTVALLTQVQNAEAGTVQEVTGSGTLYGRLTASFLAPTNGATSNSAALTFTQAGADWGTVIGFGVNDQADTGSGNFLYIGLLGDAPADFCADDLTTEFLTAGSHSLVEDDTVRVAETPGGSLPTGLSEDTTYFVSASVENPITQFALSLTEGGAAIDLTEVGSGVFVKLNSRVIQQNDTAEFAAGSLAITEA